MKRENNATYAGKSTSILFISLACLSIIGSLAKGRCPLKEYFIDTFKENNINNVGRINVDLLVKLGCAICGRDKDENTLLHTAAVLVEKPAVSKLIKLHCDVNAQNDVGMTPLHFAFMRKYTTKDRQLASKASEIIDLLVGAGANLNLKNKLELTPQEFGEFTSTMMPEFNEKELFT